MSDQDKPLNDCGCCEGVTPLTPASIRNVPGLSALAYRVGTHGSFKATMLAGLSSQPKLRELTTRYDDDPSIALLDAWAAVLDILSFYQERIANEGYLQTATERRSILEMARSIGYELRPGVAASTYLAFALETSPGAPASAKIPIGTKAQSTPKQDQQPQLFETIEAIEAWPVFNDLKPLQREFVPPALGTDTVYLKGTATNLKKGDALLIIGDERVNDPGNENWDFRRVAGVTPVATTDAETSYTVVKLDKKLGSMSPRVEPAHVKPRVYALRQRAALFGYNAPDWKAMPNALKAGYLNLDPGISDLNDKLKPFTEWPGFNIASISDPPPRTTAGSGLYGEYYNGLFFVDRALTRTDPTINFDWGGGSPDPRIDANTFSIRWTGWLQPKVTGDHTFFVVVDDGARLRVDGKLVIDTWTPQGAAEHPSEFAIHLVAGEKYDIQLDYYEQAGFASVKLLWAAPGVAKEIIPASQLFPRDIHDVHLDAIYPQIQSESWAVLSIPGYQEVYRVKSVSEDARAGFTLSMKTTRLQLQGENLRELFDEKIRGTVVFGQSEELLWAEQPIKSPVIGNSVVLDRKIDGLGRGRLVAISGVDAGTEQAAAEIATVDRVETAGDKSTLVFISKLGHSYRRDSMVLNANVARATHGETKNETLGSGDASKPFQKFVLKQKPLTFISAATASGEQTTLELRVNDVLWEEAPNFYQLPPDRRAYVTRIADDGKVTVQFGDGTTGARPPTGAENVMAKYRTGIGIGGMLDARQINLLMSRPLGVKEVINPLPPNGAQDPERLDQARQNAPLTVLTLDRIVSLQDFEDFTRAFAGIGKVQATWLWDGERRLVHLTIAGAGGSSLPPASDPFKNLTSAVDLARHTDQRVRIDPYHPLLFDVEARLLIDPHYLFDNVKAAVEATLQEAFSFEARSFGQGVTASEVITVAQRVPGVVAVDLEKLYFEGGAPMPNMRLPARTARWAGNQILPAELLTIRAGGIKLTEIK